MCNVRELARMYKEHSQQSLRKGKQKVDEMKPIPGSMLVSTYQRDRYNLYTMVATLCIFKCILRNEAVLICLILLNTHR